MKHELLTDLLVTAVLFQSASLHKWTIDKIISAYHANNTRVVALGDVDVFTASSAAALRPG